MLGVCATMPHHKGMNAKKLLNKKKRDKKATNRAMKEKKKKDSLEEKVGFVPDLHYKKEEWRPYENSLIPGGDKMPLECPYTLKDVERDDKFYAIVRVHGFNKHNVKSKGKYPNYDSPRPHKMVYEQKLNGQKIGRSRWNEKYGLLWQKTNSKHTSPRTKMTIYANFKKWWKAYYHGIFD